MTGLPLPKEAQKAVSIPAMPRSTVKPSFSKKSAKQAAERYSCKESSAKPQMLSERAVRSLMRSCSRE